MLKSVSLGLMAALVLSACVTQAPYTAPHSNLPQTFPEARPMAADGNWKPASPQDLQDRGDWWTVFGEPELARLESRIATANPSLAAAMARLQAARAQTRVARSAYFPVLSGNVSASRQRTSADVVGRALAGKTVNDFSTGLDVSWEPDLFGKVTHAVSAADASQQATAADAAALRLSLQAELALDYFDLRDAIAQQAILQRTVDSYQHAVKLVQARFGVGIASELDVSQAETQLQATQAQLQDSSIRRAQLEHAIGSLVDEPGVTLTAQSDTSDSKPPLIPAGLPSVLLQRRPDIAAAERRVSAAYSNVGVARAAFFPDILLAASGGRESSAAASWLTLPARFWTIGPSIAGTILDGGRRRAEADIANAQYQEAAANYRQVVLTAFQEVQDELQACDQLQSEALVQTAAVGSANRALGVALDRYRAGAVNYLEVVTAQSTALANQRVAADISRRRLDAAVRLIKALGGSWG